MLDSFETENEASTVLLKMKIIWFFRYLKSLYYTKDYIEKDYIFTTLVLELLLVFCKMQYIISYKTMFFRLSL